MQDQNPPGDASAPYQPVPTRRGARRGCMIRLAVTVAGVLLLCSLVSVWLVPYGRHQSTHDIPNPFWSAFNKAYTYSPDQGPPNPDLLDSRPEAVVLQFIADYRKVAGTYPCAQNLAHYDPYSYVDPVLFSQNELEPAPAKPPCAVHRPVAAVIASSVHVGRAFSPGVIPPFSGEQAEVSIEIRYTDGTQYETTMIVTPKRYQMYWFAYIHLDCWDFIGLDAFYQNTRMPFPKNALYGYDDQGNPLCQR